MASLTGSTIAESYEQLLSLPDGGLNGNNLVAITDGDSSTAIGMKVATNKIEIIPGSNDANAFEVSQADGTAILTINSSTPSVLVSGNGTKLYFYDAGGEHISADNAGNLTIAAGAATDDLITLDSTGYIALNADGDGTVIFEDASLQYGVIENSSSDFVFRAGVQDKDIVFKGNDGGSTITAMTIDISEGGNVGIGASPDSASRLLVDHDQNAYTRILVKNTDTGSAAQSVTHYETDVGSFTCGAVSDAHSLDGAALLWHVPNKNMVFATNNTQRMIIASDGKVGINCTPAEKFNVNGDTRLDGKLGIGKSPQSGYEFDLEAASGNANMRLKAAASNQGVRVALDAHSGDNCEIEFLSSGVSQCAIRSDEVDAGLMFKVGGTGGAAKKDAFIIANTGFVGINVSSPQKMLHIEKNDTDCMIILDTSNSASDKQICFAEDYVDGNESGGDYWGVGVDASEGPDFVIAFDADSQASMGGDDDKMRISSGGCVSVGTSTHGDVGDATGIVIQGGSSQTSMKFQVKDTDTTVDSNNVIGQMSFSGDDNADAGKFFEFADSGGVIGSISANGAGNTAFNDSSDERLKKDIEDVSDSLLDEINKIKVRKFQWIHRPANFHIGLIAQELEKIVPKAVNKGGDDPKKKPYSVSYTSLVPYLIKAVQELSAKVTALENA